MKTRALLILAAAATLAGGCSTTMGGRAAPVDVTRYHLSQPIPVGAVIVQPKESVAGPEYQLYADAVVTQMAGMGFTPAAAGTNADYIATVDFNRTDRGEVRSRPPVTIGVGGGSYGGNVGVGGGVGFGIGGKTRNLYMSELAVQLRRRGDNTVIWEGRALAETLEGQAGAQPMDSANRLATALFKGFPGQSGITITVK